MAASINEMTAEIDIDAERSELAAEWSDFQAAVSQAGRIILSTHENPDGDGIGSQLALCEHLKMLGKDVRILNCSQSPSVLDFLDPNGWLEVYDQKNDEAWLKKCDLGVAFDLGDFRRLNTVGEDLVVHKIPLAGIDHHPQTGYGENGSPYSFTLIDFTAPSTGTLVWQYLRSYRKAAITRTMADALYTALVTDTGSFKYDNTDGRAHLMAMDLMKVGVRPYYIHKRVYEQRTHAQTMLLGTLIKYIQYSADRRIGWCVLTQERFAEAGAKLRDVEGFSEFIRSIKGVQVSALITEVEAGKTRVSMRSKGALPINDVAEQMGGGGHAFASGISLDQHWKEVEAQLLPLLEAKVANFDFEDGA